MINSAFEFISLNEIADVIVGIPDERTENEQGFQYKCVLPSHLQEYNQITEFDTIFRSSQINATSLLKVNDILIKRLNPSSINIIISDYPNTYVSGNIIIVRVKKEVNARFIACVLETQGLPFLQHNTTRGVAIQTISKAEIQNVRIPILPIEKQTVMGEMWLLEKEKQRLLKLLSDEESKYFKYLFDILLKSDGGFEHGNNQRRH